MSLHLIYCDECIWTQNSKWFKMAFKLVLKMALKIWKRKKEENPFPLLLACSAFLLTGPGCRAQLLCLTFRPISFASPLGPSPLSFSQAQQSAQRQAATSAQKPRPIFPMPRAKVGPGRKHSPSSPSLSSKPAPRHWVTNKWDPLVRSFFHLVTDQDSHHVDNGQWKP